MSEALLKIVAMSDKKAHHFHKGNCQRGNREVMLGTIIKKKNPYLKYKAAHCIKLSSANDKCTFLLFGKINQ